MDRVSLIAHVNAFVGWARRLKVLSGVGSMAAACWRWMVGSAEVVCAVAHAPHSRERPNHAKRPGEDALVNVKKARLRGSGGFRAVSEWRVGLPHGVGKPQPPSLQPREPN